jgi:photosynthetic reaction center H subunit
MTTRAKPASRRLGNLPTHQILPGEPDIRGWVVVGADGRRVGRVKDVLVELHSLTARHLEVRLDPGVATRAGATTIVVPVESLQVAPIRSEVHLRAVTTYDLEDVPSFVTGSEPVQHDRLEPLQRFFRCHERPADPVDFWRLRRRERAAQPYVGEGRAS